MWTASYRDWGSPRLPFAAVWRTVRAWEQGASYGAHHEHAKEVRRNGPRTSVGRGRFGAAVGVAARLGGLRRADARSERAGAGSRRRTLEAGAGVHRLGHRLARDRRRDQSVRRLGRGKAAPPRARTRRASDHHPGAARRRGHFGRGGTSQAGGRGRVPDGTPVRERDDGRGRRGAGETVGAGLAASGGLHGGGEGLGGTQGRHRQGGVRRGGEAQPRSRARRRSQAVARHRRRAGGSGHPRPRRAARRRGVSGQRLGPGAKRLRIRLSWRRSAVAPIPRLRRLADAARRVGSATLHRQREGGRLP